MDILENFSDFIQKPILDTAKNIRLMYKIAPELRSRNWILSSYFGLLNISQTENWWLIGRTETTGEVGWCFLYCTDKPVKCQPCKSVQYRTPNWPHPSLGSVRQISHQFSVCETFNYRNPSSGAPLSLS